MKRRRTSRKKMAMAWEKTAQERMMDLLPTTIQLHVSRSTSDFVELPRCSESTVSAECKGVDQNLPPRNWVRLEAEGFSGGIWVLWNREEVNIKVIHVEKHFVRMIIDEGKPTAWLLTAVYASPHHHLRPAICIATIRRETPWDLMGDFNCTLTEGERNKAGGYSWQFISWVNHLGLIDAGYSGPISLEIMAVCWRLDSQQGWIECYVMASAKNIPIGLSYSPPTRSFRSLSDSSSNFPIGPFSNWQAAIQIFRILVRAFRLQKTSGRELEFTH